MGGKGVGRRVDQVHEGVGSEQQCMTNPNTPFPDPIHLQGWIWTCTSYVADAGLSRTTRPAGAYSRFSLIRRKPLEADPQPLQDPVAGYILVLFLVHATDIPLRKHYLKLVWDFSKIISFIVNPPYLWIWYLQSSLSAGSRTILAICWLFLAIYGCLPHPRTFESSLQPPGAICSSQIHPYLCHSKGLCCIQDPS